MADFGSDRPPDDGPDSWDSEELVYRAEFATADAALVMPRHAGGTVDWYSADARTPPPGGPLPPVQETARTAFPAQFEYPGAPNDRWWAIEDAAVDIGGYPPDPHHFPTLLLIDLIVSHGTDWFLFPVATRAGHIVTLSGVEVVDSFGDKRPLIPPDGWSLFQTAGLDKGSLVVWPTAATPLEGPPVEEVTFGIDEFSNYLWAVERRVHGREVPTPPQSGPPAARDTTARKVYEYAPAEGLLPGWHPYVPRDETIDGQPRRRFVQGHILAGLEPGVELRDPTAAVLGASDNGELLFVHKVQPATVPANGMSVTRNWLLTRDADGNPILWVQRRREPLLSPPGRQVLFDVFRGAPAS